MSDEEPWLAAVRSSHERLTGLVDELGTGDLVRTSLCSDWTVAQVLSHLGSQAEIFSLLVDAGISGGDPPSSEVFGPIWDIWNARSPEDQAAESTRANRALVLRLESLDAGTLDAFRLDMFDRALDAVGLLRMRLSEHAVHTWDVAAAFDPTAEVSADAVELLVDALGDLAGRAGRSTGRSLEAAVVTSGPQRRFVLRTGESVQLRAADVGEETERSIELPAEALLRAVYGRLDAEHPPRGAVHADGIDVADLTVLFPGF